MQTTRFPSGVLAFLLLCAAVIPAANAQLQSLDDAPLQGYFAGYQNHRFLFGITSYGNITLISMGEKDKPVSKQLAVSIKANVEEILPDGKIVVRKIVPETLQSEQPKTAKLEKVVVHGKVSGEASFEIILEQKNGMISIGGRVLDPGKLTKNQLRFAVEVKFPSVYGNEKKKEQTPKRGRKNDFQEKIRNDRIILKWTDGKHKKYKSAEKVNASSKEVNGPGIAAAKIDLGAYKGRKYQFSASEGTALQFSNESTAPWHEGFKILWVPDATKDPEGKARFSFEVK